MKRTLVLSVLTSLILISCNNAGTNNEPATDTTKKADTATVTNAAANKMEDPDPTDSIPTERYPENSSSKATADIIRNALVGTLLKNDLASMSANDRKFIFSELDLNDDGQKEIFVGFSGTYFCGTGGCTIYLLNHDGSLINVFSVSDYPVVVEKQKTNGWKDLVITSAGKPHSIKFDGKKYPGNPSVAPLFKMIPSDDSPRVLDDQHFPYPHFSF